MGAIYRLTASVTDTWQLRWWILSQGADIEVIKPVAFRRDIIDEIDAMADRYKLYEPDEAGNP